jgi:hypothetical protein
MHTKTEELLEVVFSTRFVPRHTSLWTARGFQNPLPYDYVNKLFRIEAEVILNHVNPKVRGIGQGETIVAPIQEGRPIPHTRGGEAPFLNMDMSRYKVKLSLCLTNEALRYEGVWGSECIDPHWPRH